MTYKLCRHREIGMYARNEKVNIGVLVDSFQLNSYLAHVFVGDVGLSGP